MCFASLSELQIRRGRGWRARCPAHNHSGVSPPCAASFLSGRQVKVVPDGRARAKVDVRLRHVLSSGTVWAEPVYSLMLVSLRLTLVSGLGSVFSVWSQRGSQLIHSLLGQHAGGSFVY